jgi:hypothetical protein
VTPRVNAMTRIVLGLVVLLSLGACTSDGARDTGGSEASPDARSAKAEMDAEARAVLPDLVGRLGGRLNGMQATFSERGGFGIWDYQATGSVIRPAGTMSQSLATVQEVLEEHAFSVRADGDQKRVTGHKGNVTVIVESSLLSAEKKGSGLNLTIGSDGISDGDSYAESAPSEDYLGYLD